MPNQARVRQNEVVLQVSVQNEVLHETTEARLSTAKRLLRLGAGRSSADKSHPLHPHGLEESIERRRSEQQITKARTTKMTDDGAALTQRLTQDTEKLVCPLQA